MYEVMHGDAMTLKLLSTSLVRCHYNDVIMTTMASQITSLTAVYSIVYSDADQGKHQNSASLAFVWGIHRLPVNSPHKGPVTRRVFPFDDVIMVTGTKVTDWLLNRSCDVFVVTSLEEQSRGRSFKPSWPSCDVIPVAPADWIPV